LTVGYVYTGNLIPNGERLIPDESALCSRQAIAVVPKRIVDLGHGPIRNVAQGRAIQISASAALVAQWADAIFQRSY
jgi:hypothetical protein